MKVSMSGLPRIAQCAASAVLARVHEISRPFADRGKALHRFLQLVPQVGRDKAVSLVDEEWREDAACIDVSRLPASRPESFAAEVSWAYDWKTGKAREIGRDLDRAYETLLEPGDVEIPGTADSVGLYEDLVFVLDYKFGWRDLGDAGNSWQLKGLALAAARATGRRAARVAFVRIREDGSPWFQVADFSEADLDAAELDVNDLMVSVEAFARRIADGQRLEAVDVHEGPACHYCPAFDRCPAKVSLAARLADPVKLLEPLPVLTPALATQLLARLDLIDEVVGRVREKLEDYARTSPIALGDGRFWGPCEKRIDTIDAERAQPIIEQLYGGDVGREAVEQPPLKMTKEALREGLRLYVKRTPGSKITTVFDRAVEQLRKAGAVKEVRRVEFRAFRPKQLPKGQP